MNANREKADSGRNYVMSEMQRMGVGIEEDEDRLKRMGGEE